MNRKSPSITERYFATGLNMITSTGPDGVNVMTAEWVTQISYKPQLIAIFIHQGSKTLENIIKNKEFAVNVASENQTAQVSTAGGYSHSEVDKIWIKDLFKTLPPKKINTLLIDGCTINAECKLVMKKKIGDHIMLVGNVVNIKHNETKNPMIYHRGRYYKLGTVLDTERNEITINSNQLDVFKNLANGKFILKCTGVIVKRSGNVLVQPILNTNVDTIPFSIPQPNENYKMHLVRFLEKSRLEIHLQPKLVLKRLILKHGKRVQRVNFIIFYGQISGKNNYKWKAVKKDSILSALV